jgi:hypothetical protein
MGMAFLMMAALAGSSAPGARPDGVIAFRVMAQPNGPLTRQAIAQHVQQAASLLDPAPPVDYEQLAHVLEAIHLTKPICAMRIIKAGPVDQAMELAIRGPVDAPMVREANCR